MKRPRNKTNTELGDVVAVIAAIVLAGDARMTPRGAVVLACEIVDEAYKAIEKGEI